MEQSLPFGEGRISVRLPDRARVVAPEGLETGLAPLPDLVGALRSALARPLGAPPIREWVGPASRVTIAFDDPTVPCYGPLRGAAIGVVLEELAAAGVSEERVTLLCANALHRKWAPEELAVILGEDLVARFGPRLLCHDAEDPARLAYLGTTPRGYDVEVNRLVVESDLTVYVNAGCRAGFNGGWKSVCVGLSTYRSIRWTHTPDGMSMSVRDNRMHRILDEMGRHLEAAIGPRILKIETIPAGPFEVAYLWAGSVAETRRRALAVAEARFAPRRALLAEKADVVVYGVPAWSPYATFARMNPILTLVSTGLGYLGGVIEALGKPGCSVVLATPCPEEWDEEHHPAYREIWERVLAETRDPYEIHRRFEPEFATRADYIRRYRRGYAFHPVHGIMATHPLKRLRHAARVFVAGAERPELVRHLGFLPAASVEEAIAGAEAIHGSGCSIVCVDYRTG